jgi:hypothetical protein
MTIPHQFTDRPPCQTRTAGLSPTRLDPADADGTGIEASGSQPTAIRPRARESESPHHVGGSQLPAT